MHIVPIAVFIKKKKSGSVALTFDPITQGQKHIDLCEFEGSWNSKPSRAT